MSRLIDRDAAVPTRPLRVCCIGLPRTGTTSLYHALQMLGYRTYHGFEFVKNGKRDMDLLTEALEAKHYGLCRPYGRAEFDKVFGDYDAIIDLPGFAFPEELLKAYPDAKFILTDREVDGWLASMNNTVFAHARSWGLWLQSLFDDQHARPLRRLLTTWIRVFCGPDYREGAHRAYLEHVARCVELVPKERLLHLKLEDKIEWSVLCNFMGEPVPVEPYPSANNTQAYRETTRGMRFVGLWKPLVKNTMLAVAVVGIVWGLQNLSS